MMCGARLVQGLAKLGDSTCILALQQVKLIKPDRDMKIDLCAFVSKAIKAINTRE